MLAFIALAGIGALVIDVNNTEAAVGSVIGYAWSSNVGWIGFGENTSNSTVSIDSTGNFSGYAWSPAVGWINFSGVSVNSSGQVSGTATVHNPPSGWDGGIGMSGTNHPSQSGSNKGVFLNISSPISSFSGFAWSTDFGWINFDMVDTDWSPVMNFTADCDGEIIGNSYSATAIGPTSGTNSFEWSSGGVWTTGSASELHTFTLPSVTSQTTINYSVRVTNSGYANPVTVSCGSVVLDPVATGNTKLNYVGTSDRSKLVKRNSIINVEYSVPILPPTVSCSPIYTSPSPSPAGSWISANTDSGASSNSTPIPTDQLGLFVFKISCTDPTYDSLPLTLRVYKADNSEI